MAEYRIKVLPSGHEFQAQEQETLLDAALRSGLNVDFSCASGSCGVCLARLVEGQLGEHDFHDHRFSAAEVAQGKFLLCTAHAAGDLVIEAGEAKSVSDIPHQQVNAKVNKVLAVGEQLRILQLRTPRTRPLRFLAGQYVQLTLADVGSIDCSVASCPCNGAQLQFHITQQPQSAFASQLFEGLPHGCEVGVDGPFGEVTLDDDSPRPLLMLAQGHELAPIKSLIEHAINLDVAQPVRLIWLAGMAGHYLDNHCRSWGAALDDYGYIPLAYGRGESESQQAGRVLAAITAELDELGEWDIYGAGSGAFCQVLHQGLLQAGAEAQRLFMLRRGKHPRVVTDVAVG